MKISEIVSKSIVANCDYDSSEKVQVMTVVVDDDSQENPEIIMQDIVQCSQILYGYGWSVRDVVYEGGECKINFLNEVDIIQIGSVLKALHNR